MNEDNENKVEASWNIAMGFVTEIQDSLKSASYHFRRNNYFQAFKGLLSTRMRVVQYLNATERKEFKEAEHELKVILGKMNSIEEPEDNFKVYNKIIMEFEDKYGDYNDKIMDALQKYNLGIPNKEFDEGLF